MNPPPGHPLPALALDAGEAEVRAVGRDLEGLAERDPGGFEALFSPLSPHRPVRLEEGPPRQRLIALGLCQVVGDGGGGGAVVGLRRVRRHRGRSYVMDVGGGVEYRQDLWPETDALLAALDGSPAGSLLDLGTGTGIVAIEAALAGHRVVATDLYPSALALARWNATMHGVEPAIDWRQGHLFEPVAGLCFDRILAAPHYTRLCDQLRCEALGAVAPHLAPGGRAVIATFLEWEGEGPLTAVAPLLEPLARAGLSVAVRPMPPSPRKRGWFTVARVDAPDGPIAGLPSRHRFTITLDAPAAPAPATVVKVERPGRDEVVEARYAPLGSLIGDGAVGRRAGPALAVLRSDDDVAALVGLLERLRQPVVELPPHLGGLLDGCRLGSRRCVEEGGGAGGAAGAITSEDGRVRPCAHGEPLGAATDSFARLAAAVRARADEAAAARGCATCPAAAVCSRCLFPAALGAGYCDFMRAHRAELPALHRYLAVAEHLDRVGWLARPARLKQRRAVPLIAARGRPPPTRARPADAGLERAAAAVLEGYRARGAWLVATATGHALQLPDGARSWLCPLSATTAAVAELLDDGQSAAELEAYLVAQHLGAALGPELGRLAAALEL